MGEICPQFAVETLEGSKALRNLWPECSSSCSRQPGPIGVKRRACVRVFRWEHSLSEEGTELRPQKISPATHDAKHAEQQRLPGSGRGRNQGRFVPIRQSAAFLPACSLVLRLFLHECSPTEVTSPSGAFFILLDELYSIFPCSVMHGNLPSQHPQEGATDANSCLGQHRCSRLMHFIWARRSGPEMGHASC